MTPKRILSVLFAVFLLSSMAGCGGADERKMRGQAVTDMRGREIALEGAVERIVVLSAADCEIVYALGAGDLVVGRGEYCDYPAEAADLPVVQSGQDTNVEQVIALAPQAVVMSAMAQTDEQIAALEKAGVTVVVSDAQDIEGVYTAIQLIGDVTGKPQEAADLAKTMRERLNAVKARAAQDTGEGPSVYFEVSPLEWGLWTAGMDTFMNEIAVLLRLRNVFNDVGGWAEISQEQVIERDPNVIVTVAMYAGEGPLPEEEILARAGWQKIDAVRHGAVYQVDNDAFSRPGPRLVEAAETLCDLIYG